MPNQLPHSYWEEDLSQCSPKHRRPEASPERHRIVRDLESIAEGHNTEDEDGLSDDEQESQLTFTVAVWTAINMPSP